MQAGRQAGRQARKSSQARQCSSSQSARVARVSINVERAAAARRKASGEK